MAEEGQGAPQPAQTFTQADVDRIVSERLSRERARYADYDDLKAKASEYDKAAEAQKTEQQRLAEQLQAAQSEAERYRTESLRLKVATDKGVPAALIPRLQGASEEELAADADELLKVLPQQQAAPPAAGRPVAELRSGALPPEETGPTDMNEWMRRKRGD